MLGYIEDDDFEIQNRSVVSSSNNYTTVCGQFL